MINQSTTAGIGAILAPEQTPAITDPRWRVFCLALRNALYIVGDALGVLCGVGVRGSK